MNNTIFYFILYNNTNFWLTINNTNLKGYFSIKNLIIGDYKKKIDKLVNKLKLVLF